MLGAAGVPVLPMMEVSSEAGAVAAAERLGYPVVVKPCHGGQGRAVALNLPMRAGGGSLPGARPSATAS